MVKCVSFPNLQAEELRQLVLFQLRADDAEAPRVVGMAGADLVLLGHEVELDPRAVLAGDDALGPEDPAVLAGVQGGQDALDVGRANTLGVSLPQEVNTSSA